MVLLVVLGVVLGVARLVGGTGSDEQPADRAAPAAQVAPQAPEQTYGPLRAVPVKPRKAQGVAPAEPSGPCAVQDISAVPVLDTPEAGSPVRIGVELTGTQPACTFEVSPDTLVVKVVDEKGNDFWLSADCEGVVPKQQVVVRSAVPTTVTVKWNARASDRGCDVYSRWAFPGFYDALASVPGSLPGETRFELVPPGVRYVTETPSPTATPTRKPTRKPAASGAASPSASPSGSPSPSATPRG